MMVVASNSGASSTFRVLSYLEESRFSHQFGYRSLFVPLTVRMMHMNL